MPRDVVTRPASVTTSLGGCLLGFDTLLAGSWARLRTASGGFAQELAAYMSALIAPCAPSSAEAHLVARLGTFDFGRASRDLGVHLVASVPGIVPLRLPTRAPSKA